jgi:hypothetical protein
LATKGDIDAAAKLMTLRLHSKKFGDSAPMIIRITGGLPPEPTRD